MSMTYDLEINGFNAYARWGAVLGDGSLAALLTPPPMKEYITNECTAVHGKVIASAEAAMPKVDSRDLQLTIFIHASNPTAFYNQYDSLVAEMQKGRIVMRTRQRETVYYRLYYMSCSQYSQFNGRMGKFVFRFNEPDPTDRAQPQTT